MRHRSHLLLTAIFVSCGPAPTQICWEQPPQYPPSDSYHIDVYGEQAAAIDDPSEVGLTDLVATIDGDHLTFAYTDKLGRDVRVTYRISPEGEGL